MKKALKILGRNVARTVIVALGCLAATPVLRRLGDLVGWPASTVIVVAVLALVFTAYEWWRSRAEEAVEDDEPSEEWKRFEGVRLHIINQRSSWPILAVCGVSLAASGYLIGNAKSKPIVLVVDENDLNRGAGGEAP
jgi:hypothetical protein